MADFPCSSLWNAKVGIKWEIGLLLPLLPRNQSDWVPGAARLLSELSRHPPPTVAAPPKSLLQELAGSSTFSEVPKVRVAKKKPCSDHSPALEATKELWPGKYIL